MSNRKKFGCIQEQGYVMGKHGYIPINEEELENKSLINKNKRKKKIMMDKYNKNNNDYEY